MDGYGMEAPLKDLPHVSIMAGHNQTDRQAVIVSLNPAHERLRPQSEKGCRAHTMGVGLACLSHMHQEKGGPGLSLSYASS